MKLRDLAAAIDAEVVGDGDVVVTHVAPVESGGPGALVMVREAHYLPQAQAGTATALLLPPDFHPANKPALRARDVRVALARAIGLLHPVAPSSPGIHPTAVIGARTTLGADVRRCAGQDHGLDELWRERGEVCLAERLRSHRPHIHGRRLIVPQVSRLGE